MKIGAIPENEMERAALEAGVVPLPMLDGAGVLKARTVMAGVRLGVFEAIGGEELAVGEVARRCGTHPAATEKLLNALAGADYLEKDGERYRLSPAARKWLIKDSPQPVSDFIRMQYLEWDWLGYTEDYIRSGQPYIIHPHMSEEDWGVYQRGMRAVAGLRAEEVARITPVPEGARDLLDVGGSHGYFSVALCRRYPDLRAVVLDLPQAVKHAAPILAKEGMGERVTHRAGNALTEDLGAEAWDLILIANLIQNFDEAANRELFKRAAHALRPGGVLVIQESFQRSTPENAGLDTLLLDFLFSMTSASKTWSEEEIAAWQREAGLEPRETVYFPGSRDYGQQSAMKPLR